MKKFGMEKRINNFGKHFGKTNQINSEITFDNTRNKKQKLLKKIEIL